MVGWVTMTTKRVIEIERGGGFEGEDGKYAEKHSRPYSREIFNNSTRIARDKVPFHNYLYLVIAVVRGSGGLVGWLEWVGGWLVLLEGCIPDKCSVGVDQEN